MNAEQLLMIISINHFMMKALIVRLQNRSNKWAFPHEVSYSLVTACSWSLQEFC